MGELKWTERELYVPLDRVATATLGGDALYLVRHRDLASFRVEGEMVDPWHPPVEPELRARLDDRNLQVAIDAQGTMYVLLADGSVCRRGRSGDFQAVTASDVRLAGHYAHRVGFVWDDAGEQLVVAGGDHRNDWYSLRPGATQLVHGVAGPPHGAGTTVATRHGVYRMVNGELWLLRGAHWALVGRHDRARADRGALLFWDPQRDALFFITQQLGERPGPPVMVQWAPTGPAPAVEVPGTFEGPLAMHEAVAEVDPATGWFWVFDRTGARRLDLSEVLLDVGCPIEPLGSSGAVVSTPPVHWYREALALTQTEQVADDLKITVRDGWVLAATLPVSPHLPLGTTGTVLLFSRESPYDHDPWTLGFLNAFEVRIVDEIFPLTAGGMSLAQTKYFEVDPIYAQRVDTRPDGAPFLSRGSKIGGWPALVYGSKEGAANALVADLSCEDCEARLRFVAQLGWPEWDLISARIFVYACPFGHSGAAYAQNA